MNRLLQEDEKIYEAILVLEFESDREASVVFGSISPDNTPLPQGLEVSSEIEGRRIVFHIRCKRPIMSLLATLDDILKMSALAEGISSSTKS